MSSDGERRIEILEVFTEAGELPSYTRERRAWRAAIRRLDRQRQVIERWKLNYFADKMLRVRPIVEPMPAECFCSWCGRPWTLAETLRFHESACAERKRSA